MVLRRKRRAARGHTQLLQFLENADDAYILAFSSKNIRPLVPYADATVCNAVLCEILSGEDKSFGVAERRDRTWEVILNDGHVASIVKTLSHEPINCGRGMSITLGDNIKQTWDVSVGGDGTFKVLHIGRACRCE